MMAALLCVVFASSSHAADPQNLGAYFEKTLARADTAMQEPGFGEALARAQLQDFNPEFTAQASFGLSGVVQLSIAPELDLVFVPSHGGAAEGAPKIESPSN